MKRAEPAPMNTTSQPAAVISATPNASEGAPVPNDEPPVVRSPIAVAAELKLYLPTVGIS